MSDVLNPQQRHRCMSHIRSKATKPEMLVRRWLWAHGYRYRLNVKSVPGKPDIVMRKYRTAIFVNGCFWHGHEGCKQFVLPKTKIEAKGRIVYARQIKELADIFNMTEKLGQNSPARLIAEALDMCASGKGITAEVKDSKTVNKGVVNGADFTVTFDDGLPCSMEIGGEIGVTFKNVRAE